MIPTFDEQEVIGDCLTSLTNQSYKDMEIIVVDDGSEDKTVELVKKFKGVKLLRQDHGGPGSARNKGARVSKGEILVFVDADMTFDIRFIEKLVAPIVTGKAKGSFSKDEIVSNIDNWWSKNWNYETSGSESSKRLPKNYPSESPVFRSILKEEFERVGGFDLIGYNDDWSLSEKLGYKARLAKDAVYYHKNPDSGMEVWKQAQWVGRRRYKLGLIGRLIGLIRTSLPISLISGLIKSVKIKRWSFVGFKLFYDLAIFSSILVFLVNKKHAR